MDIGMRIKSERKKACLTQKELAEKAGIAVVTLQQYERGKREPRLNQLMRISAALGMSIYDLVGPEVILPYSPNEVVKSLDVLKGSKSEILLNAFEQLNDEGQQKAVERVEELTEIPRYQKDPAE